MNHFKNGLVNIDLEKQTETTLVRAQETLHEKSEIEMAVDSVALNEEDGYLSGGFLVDDDDNLHNISKDTMQVGDVQVENNNNNNNNNFVFD